MFKEIILVASVEYFVFVFSLVLKSFYTFTQKCDLEMFKIYFSLPVVYVLLFALISKREIKYFFMN